MRVNEIFESIQGEGRFSGYPALFIRLSGCNRECDFCDTKYHKNGKTLSINDIVKTIKKSKLSTVVWTGGEPLIQINDIINVIKKTRIKHHHVETNGDLVNDDLIELFNKYFSYICVSPKDLKTAMKFKKLWLYIFFIDIKIVTDLVDKKILKYATMLMPLTTSSSSANKMIEQNVWNYCVKKNIKFCLREHIHVWGAKKGV